MSVSRLQLWRTGTRSVCVDALVAERERVSGCAVIDISAVTNVRHILPPRSTCPVRGFSAAENLLLRSHSAGMSGYER